MSATDLPTLNAILNASSAGCLLVGWWLVRSGRREGHRRAMLAALDGARLSRRPRREQLHEVIGAHVRCVLDEFEGYEPERPQQSLYLRERIELVEPERDDQPFGDVAAEDGARVLRPDRRCGRDGPSGAPPGAARKGLE